MRVKDYVMMDCGYFFCPYISLDGDNRLATHALRPHPEEEEVESAQPAEEKVDWLKEGF